MFLSVHNEVIPKDLCDSILKVFNSSTDVKFKEASLNGKITPSYRNNYDLKITDENLHQKLWSCIYKYLPVIYQNKNLIGYDKYKVYALKYEPGQFFKKHTDGYSFDKKGNKSLLTVQIYLNDDFKGGETTFFENSELSSKTFVYKPQKGGICIFDHKILHEGNVLIEGIKYCLRFNVIYDIMPISLMMTDYMDINTYQNIRYKLMEPAVTISSNSNYNTIPGNYKEIKYDLLYDICNVCGCAVNIDDKLCKCGGNVNKNEYVYSFRKKGMWIPK